jgi:membrane protease YdiL (CAAX protease family)
MIRLIAVLVAYGNARSFVEPSAIPETPWAALAFGLALTLAVVVLTRAGPRLTPAELGLVRRGSVRAAMIGALVGVGASLPALLVLHYPPLLDAPVRYAPLADIPTDALLIRALVLMPLDTALPEELAFRGALFGWIRRDHGAVRAIIVSSMAFAAWHVVIVVATLRLTNAAVHPLTAGIGIFAAFVAVFGGGVMFALLRARTERLAAPLAAHAAFNAAILLGLGL